MQTSLPFIAVNPKLPYTLNFVEQSDNKNMWLPVRSDLIKLNNYYNIEPTGG